MVKILEPQYGNDFVGRGEKIDELKEKIKDNGFIIVTGNRGIGKTNLTLVVEEALNEEKAGFLKKKPCYHVNGSFFYEEVNRIFAPSKRLTGFSGSVSTPIAGAGGGLSWNPREPFILEYMAKSKDKILFLENAHELRKEDFETILEATRRNDRLRFVLEIATPYQPDVTIRPGSYEFVKLSELRDDAIEQIVRKECPLFSDTIVQRIVALSMGYPYVARSLAYICDNKDSEEEISQFLQTLRDEDMEHNLNKIHGEVLATLHDDSQAVIKRLAIAPATLNLNLIAAFCGDDVDPSLTDLSERGFLITSEEKIYRIYHPLFREYLRSIQPVALKTKQRIYSAALEKVKGEFDSVIILFEVLDEPFFEGLLKQTENYEVLNFVGIQAYTWGKIEHAFSAWMHIFELAKTKDKAWESIAMGNIGIVYQIKGDLDKALEYYGKSLKLDEELGRKEGMANQLGNIGIVYQIKGDLDKALEYHGKSLKLNEELGKKEGMANQLGNIGIVYGIKGDLDKALEYYQRTLKLFKEMGSRIETAKTLMNIGDVFFLKDDKERALNLYLEAQDLVIEYPLPLFESINERITRLLRIG